MLDNWKGEARVDRVQEEVIQAVVQRLRSYDGLSPQSRANALKGLWKRIGDTYPEAQQKPRSVPSNGEGTQQRARPPQPPPEPSLRPEPAKQEQYQQKQRPAALPRSDSMPVTRIS